MPENLPIVEMDPDDEAACSYCGTMVTRTVFIQWHSFGACLPESPDQEGEGEAQ